VNCYTFSYSTYEECAETVLLHDEKFTSEECQQLFADAYVWAWNQESRKEHEDTFQDLYASVIGYLISNYQFVEQEYDAVTNVFGWARVGTIDSWSSSVLGDSLERTIQKRIIAQEAE
jgi:hypothetical protein